MRTDGTVVDLRVRFGEGAWTQQLWIWFGIFSKAQEVINVWNLTEVRTNRVDEQQLQQNVSFNQILSWLVFTVQNIQILHTCQVMETVFNDISVNHFFISFLDSHDLLLHFIFKDLVESSIRTFILFLSHLRSLLNALVHEHLESWKLENGGVSILSCEVCVIDWVPSQSTGQTGSIGAVLCDGINQVNEISCWLGHLFAFDQNIAVAIISLRPEFRIVPNSDVVVQSHGQMIFYQIFSWTPQIHWIPIQERFSNFIQFVLRDLLWSVLLSEQNKVPEIRSDVFMSDTQNTNFRAVQIALQQVSEGIKGKVNGWVRQWFNQILVIKRQFSTQTERSGATPLLQPVDSINQVIMQDLTVALELSLNVVQNLLLPLFMSIVNVPLLTVGNDTFITRTRNDFSSRLEIFQGQTCFDQIFSDQILGLCDF